MIAHPRNPRVQLLREDVCIAIDERVTLLLSTESECDHLIGQIVKARTLLEQQAKARSERARLLGTASGVPTHVRLVTTTADLSCTCTPHFICDKHVQGGAA